MNETMFVFVGQFWSEGVTHIKKHMHHTATVSPGKDLALLKLIKVCEHTRRHGLHSLPTCKRQQAVEIIETSAPLPQR